MVGPMKNVLLISILTERFCCSTELMKSTAGREEGFAVEVIVVAARLCCHSEHSAESHCESAGEAGSSMQGVKEGTEAEGLRYTKEMWLLYVFKH